MLLFPNGSYIEENHRTSLHCFRDVLYMLLLQNVWNHSKIIFSKKGTKKRQVYAPKGLQKRTLAQNCFNLTIQNKITTKLFLYKKDKKFIFSTSNDIKKLRQL